MKTSMRCLAVAALATACGALVVHSRINTSEDIAENATLDFTSDQKLNLKTLVQGSHCLGGWNAINPSFAFVPSTTNIAVAFRGLCMTKSGGSATWYSKMVVGVIPTSAIRHEDREHFPWKSFQVAPDLRFHHTDATMTECALPGADEAYGPEDPRLVKTRGGLYAIVTGYDLVHMAGAKTPKCGHHGMLLYAAKVKSLSPPMFSAPVKLTFPGMGKIEKNWAMFTPPAAKGAVVKGIYSIYPHRIMNVDLHSGSVKFICKSESMAVEKLAHKLGVKAADFHGGAGVAHVKTEHGSYFLSMLHVAKHMPHGGKEYWNFPYTFSTQSPHRIMHIGKKIPLVLHQNPAYGERVAFVTTMLYDKGDVFIGYGSGDRESRTFRMPLHVFNAKFFPTSFLSSSLDETMDVAEELDLEEEKEEEEEEEEGEEEDEEEEDEEEEARSLLEDDGLVNTTHVDSLSDGNITSKHECFSRVAPHCRGELTPSICRSHC